MGMIVFLFLLILFCIFMIVKTSKTSKKAKKENQELMNEKNASIVTSMQHANGLPVPDNVMCKIISCEDHYEFIANGASFNVDKSKVTDVSVKTETEIHQQYVSSVGGAVAGAVIAGPLGAMVGGRAKKKESRTYTKYLIFTYLSDEEVKYITFKDLGNAYLFVKEFNTNKSNAPKTTINL